MSFTAENSKPKFHIIITSTNSLLSGLTLNRKPLGVMMENENDVVQHERKETKNYINLWLKPSNPSSTEHQLLQITQHVKAKHRNLIRFTSGSSHHTQIKCAVRN